MKKKGGIISMEQIKALWKACEDSPTPTHYLVYRKGKWVLRKIKKPPPYIPNGRSGEKMRGFST